MIYVSNVLVLQLRLRCPGPKRLILMVRHTIFNLGAFDILLMQSGDTNFQI